MEGGWPQEPGLPLKVSEVVRLWRQQNAKKK